LIKQPTLTGFVTKKYAFFDEDLMVTHGGRGRGGGGRSGRGREGPRPWLCGQLRGGRGGADSVEEAVAALAEDLKDANVVVSKPTEVAVEHQENGNVTDRYPPDEYAAFSPEDMQQPTISGIRDTARGISAVNTAPPVKGS
jgi:hypothetical protein